MRSCFCPSCGASLNLDDENRDFGFCQYCGARIMLDDYRSTHRIVDEARIREDETNRMIRMRELEIAEREREQARADEERERLIEQQRVERENKKSRKAAFVSFCIAAAVIVIGVIMIGSGDEDAALFGLLVLMIGINIIIFTLVKRSNKKREYEEANNARLGMIKLTFDPEDFEDKNYQSVRSLYTGIGFQNVSAIDMRDLLLGLIEKPGEVESVTINGEDPVQGKWYYPNAVIIIKYHGFKNR